jgi:hypothetical protein
MCTKLVCFCLLLCVATFGIFNFYIPKNSTEFCVLSVVHGVVFSDFLDYQQKPLKQLLWQLVFRGVSFFIYKYGRSCRQTSTTLRVHFRLWFLGKLLAKSPVHSNH